MLPITIGSVLSKVSRQAVVVLLSRAASFFLAIASAILLSRLLGTPGFGRFRLGSVVVQLLTTFCLLGLDGGLLRYLPVLETHGGNGSRALLARSSRVVIAISLALSVALLLGAPALATYYFHSPGMTNVLRVFSLQVPVLVLLRFLSGAVTAAKRVDFASRIANILSPAIFLALLALIGFVHPGLYGPIAARIRAQLAAVLCLVLFLMRRYPKVPKVEPVADNIFRDYLRLSMPVFFIGIGYQLLNQMDTIMLGHFASERDVGIYSVAVKVSSFVQVYMLFGLRAHNLKYLKGVFAIGGAGLIGYLVRSWLSNVGYSDYTIGRNSILDYSDFGVLAARIGSRG